MQLCTNNYISFDSTNNSPDEEKPDLLPHDSARPHDQLGDMEGAGRDDVHLAQQPGVHLSVYLDNTAVFL